MKNIILILVVAWISSAVYAENLLINPDAETGNMSGWVVSPSGMASATGSLKEATGYVEPYEGIYFFRFNQGSFGTIYQEVGLNDPNASYIYAGGMMNNELYIEGIDTGELVLTFFDSSDNELTSYTTGELAYAFRGDTVVGAEGYGSYGLIVPVPEDAVIVRYQINGYLHAGSYINTFIDNLFLEVVPNLPDFYQSNYIDLFDFSLFAQKWQTEQGDMNWDPKYDIAQPPDGIIDITDFKIFVLDWLNTI